MVAIARPAPEREEVFASVHSATPFQSAPRFTLDGDDALERNLALACERVVSGVRGIFPETILQTIVLGGGYGRGEGGVLRSATGDRPYNDLEFYVLVQGNRHLAEALYRQPLDVLGHILTHLADVEVEFKIATLAELTVRPPSMFTYDLLAGHRVVWSRDPAQLRLAAPAPASHIPMAEATRLLMNRCTGLLLAGELLQRPDFPDTAADFVRRNIAKAELACGDAVLTTAGLYHWSCRARRHRLQAYVREHRAPWLEAVQRHHDAGVAFKLHPRTGPAERAELAAAHAAISDLARRCWLWVESQRLSHQFEDIRAYALDDGDKWPGESGLRNILLSLKAGGPAAALDNRRMRHPRERLLRVLPLLLWEPAALTDPALKSRLQSDLRTPAATPAEALCAYRALWEKVR